ncbi:hypothetical protein BKP37_01705 [Anaerobacillus alkalilacustris]|uniref:histidine kinase n=1 Tax=Anaerobacillus alkalilacustris TaxID=393763 RepID=A0A1S2LXK4_9BACI|nr:PAS domain-containing sensor histidine kinase [Anaerobacillus alkalilacustris]OIJ17242.1 hypothetical protein BKP37_01705 [Anaerobacillus alkalilacustris]
MDVKKIDGLDILDKITDGFYVLDSNWHFIYLNQVAENMFNRPKGSLLGSSLWEQFPQIIELPIFSYFHLAMKKQQSVSFELYYPLKNQWFDFRAYPSKETLSVYFVNITSSKRKSIKREQHYQSLFTNNPDAVYSFDIKGRYISVNKALEELTGYRESELIDQSFHHLIAKEDLEKTMYFFNEAANGLSQTYYCKIIHKSGRLIHCKVTNIPITIENKVIGVYGICKDITLQKVAEESIEKAEKLSLVGQLSASIAHEIRNPLTTLKGFLQLIKKEKEVNPTHLEILLNEMNRIEMITSELLLLAKPQAVQFTNGNIKDTINDVVTLLQSQALMKNIEIIFEYEKVGSISYVSNQLKQVFINLIKNAIESMTDGGVIKVVLFDYSQENILIEVIDQGCGISDDLAPNIGMPFYSTKEKGTGLGMLTTFKIINEHNGKIEFKSKLGEGTTFRVFLPKIGLYSK